MSYRPKPTTFWGPQKNYMRLPDWPYPFNIHLQLHDLQPGEFWNPTDGAAAQVKRILTPTGSPGNFKLFVAPLFWQYRHKPERFHIHGDFSFPPHTYFEVVIQHGPQQFAYNNITEPEGVFAHSGYASMAWEAL